MKKQKPDRARTRAAPATERPRGRVLVWAALFGLVSALIGLGEIAEDWLRVLRNGTHQHAASGNIVFVAIDDKSLREIGNWPWPRSVDGKVIDRLHEAGAKKILLDINFAFPSEAKEDVALARSIERAGNVSLFTRSKVGKTEKLQTVVDRPLPIFSEHAKLALADVEYNFHNVVWNVPYATLIGGNKVDSFAAQLADHQGATDTAFPVDYSVELTTIPTYSASDILSGNIPSHKIAGKNVIFGAGSELLNDTYFIPGQGQGNGAQVQILAAETLLQGIPLSLGWIPALVFAIAAAALALTNRSNKAAAAIVLCAMLFLLLFPTFLESRLIFVEITPGVFVLLVVGGVMLWRRYWWRGMVNEVTNLPNLNALRLERSGREKALIAARILNYEEILATLPPNGERSLVEQIVSRINVGAFSRTIYQGDGGIFAWFDDSKQSFGHHLDALSALFRTPARVHDMSLDLSISFGVEVGSNRTLASRLASALVAADEAAHDGLKWKYYDPETFADASWRLSMLSQLDDAIDQGEVWVAYQPKLDLASRRIIGAEALARWTHPEKGPIAATEFVAAAEQSNRIAKLTDFVLDKAVSAAAELNRRGPGFDIAVNLSARLLTDKGFTLRLSALLARHKLDPKHLTLELTETATLAGSGEGIEMLARLRDLGVRIAIDDYGTGLSTLDYLKRIPANEIKIDQSFVKGIVENRSDRLMVQSTIGLAHSLGRLVVAEGVEHREIIDILTEMNCDIAQGFAVGRPMSLESLSRRMTSERKRSAA
ncbi:MAG: EAL domain-containing protein [Sphingomicrobium sp.]